MISFFESPFDRFLFLDADTVLCGDLNRINDLDHYDFIIDKRSTYGTDYQVVTNDYPAHMLKSRFDSAVAQPDAVQHPVVYHFCGQKPFVFQNAPYTEPMTYFRLMFKKTFGTCKGMFAWLALLAEDLVYLHVPALKRKARSALRIIFRQGKRLFGQA